MTSLKVKITKKDLLRSKFADTITQLYAYIHESESDIGHRVTYAPTRVYTRMVTVMNTLQKDLKNLENDIEI